MSIQAVLLPLFVEVLLTFALLGWLAVRRGRDLTGGTADPRTVALREPNWPSGTQQIAYSFSNQFELPVLFYVLTILVVITRHADLLFVILAWVFVVLRLFHACVHTTNNNLNWRGGIYAAGGIALAVMWVVFAVRLLAGLP